MTPKQIRDIYLVERDENGRIRFGGDNKPPLTEYERFVAWGEMNKLTPTQIERRWKEHRGQS